jgi:hypothetical protein
MYEIGSSSVTILSCQSRSVAGDLGVEGDEFFGDSFRSFFRE